MKWIQLAILIVLLSVQAFTAAVAIKVGQAQKYRADQVYEFHNKLHRYFICKDISNKNCLEYLK